VTALATGLNFLGFNPMHALVWSGIVQKFLRPASSVADHTHNE
jgi:hypothetical protein